ncbi:EAL domain-containing protein [Curvibacter sp. APW13]|uniref:EAL domain-containing protein n=1 Tax=Curvibacter sp. APW13 TaxID=3077236 RepID=UPI0028DF6CFA|nr:EAL domain-containing protein [Curvibacter sp. APW13]MDT8992027.1 EAL domain-containing protein [Curvibacter sp. APW13]
MPPTNTGLNREVIPAHTLVFSTGDAGDAAYVIESGSVEVLAGPPTALRRVATLEAGAMFGEVALLDRQSRTATVRTLAPTTLVRIDRAHVDELLARSDPVIQYLLRLLLERYRSTSGAPGASAAALPSEAAPGESVHSAAVRTLSLLHDLTQALESDQLALYYQPLINLQDGRRVGYEALMRWRHPTLGLVSPDEFIGLAEKTGIIARIGQWGLRRAAQDWPRLRAAHPDDAPPFVSVNLSAPELCTPGIVEQIHACLQQFDMPMSALRIELTETTVVNNLQAVIDSIAALRALGSGVALDDFGTGYAGLEYLQNMPFSSIKIDRAFVEHMHTSSRSYFIIQSALELSRKLGVNTVAEGIEDARTAEALAAMGCHIGQGYHFARPMPLDELEARGIQER